MHIVVPHRVALLAGRASLVLALASFGWSVWCLNGAWHAHPAFRDPGVQRWGAATALAAACILSLLYAERSALRPGIRLRWWQSAVEASTDGVFLTDRHLRIVDCNDRCREMLGFSRRELRGQGLECILPFEPGLQLQAAQSTERFSHARVRAMHRDGSRIWLDVYLHFHRFGRKHGYIAFARASNTQSPSEPLYREEVRFLTNLLDFAPAVFLAMDSRGCVVRMSETAEQILGYSAAEIRLTPYWQMFLQGAEAGQAQSEFQMLDRNFATDSHRVALPTVDQTWKTRSGVYRRLRWTRNLVLDEKGALTHVIAVGHPVEAVAAAVPGKVLQAS
ncbi:MAG: PAS domain S-box protein [Bryobacteraceae bacterium]